MNERSLSTVEDFEAMHAEIRAEWAQHSNEQKTQWEFFVPLVMKLADDMPRPASISLLGSSFVLDTWKAVESTLGTENVDRAFAKHSLKVEQRPETSLLLTTDGMNSFQAWDSIVPAFDLFRGLLEFVYGFSRRSMSFGGGPSARTIFPLYQWFLARDATQGLEALLFMSDRPPRPNVQILVPKGFDNLTKLAGVFSTTPTKGSTVELLADSFRLYAQALDEPFLHTCLLGLWQMAEKLTLSNRGDTKIVCERLVGILEKTMPSPPSGLPEILRVIADKRNRIVHHGIHDTVDDEDINILKVICEMTLASLIHAVDKLPSQKYLNQFLVLSTSDDLEVINQALQWVQQLEAELKSAIEPKEKSL